MWLMEVTLLVAVKLVVLALGEAEGEKHVMKVDGKGRNKSIGTDWQHQEQEKQETESGPFIPKKMAIFPAFPYIVQVLQSRS